MDRNTLQHRCDIAAWIGVGIGLFAVLRLNLLPALLAGLLVYEIVHVLAPRLGFLRISRERGKVAAVGVLASLIIVVLVAGGVGIGVFFRSDAGSLTALLNKLAEILDGARTGLPSWIVERLPEGVEALKSMAVQWLKDHARELQSAGKEAGLGAVHVLIGMVIGAMVALHDARPVAELGPLSRALQERVVRLGEAFRRIVFAQVRISALNTVLTGVFLVAVLPMFGLHLPLMKTMIVITFLAGLLPVVGNLISNSVIVLVGLSVSLPAAAACLAFLIIIHKLEYFVNARIVGSQIHARAWELLVAMLIMEAMFGVAGIVAAPIFYAYLKDELKTRGVL
ncbi:MAG: AI-2E family transporter [Burkholderiales bacterium]